MLLIDRTKYYGYAFFNIYCDIIDLSNHIEFHG